MAFQRSVQMDATTRRTYTRPNMIDASNDIPNRFELFILGDDEKKVSEEIDTRMRPPPSNSMRNADDEQAPPTAPSSP
jgi:hypothetical protein